MKEERNNVKVQWDEEADDLLVSDFFRQHVYQPSGEVFVRQVVDKMIAVDQKRRQRNLYISVAFAVLAVVGAFFVCTVGFGKMLLPLFIGFLGDCIGRLYGMLFPPISLSSFFYFVAGLLVVLWTCFFNGYGVHREAKI